MGAITRLTEMQMKFAHEVVSNEGRKNGTECAISAGYANDSAGVRAAELQNPKKFPLVVRYIGELRDEYQKKYAVTFERHIAELGKLRMEALKKGAWSAAINAEVARGKAAGLYIEQKIIRTGKIDDLSEAELENRMKEIIEQYSPILDAKPIEEIKEEVKKLNSPLKKVTQEISKSVEDINQEDPQKQTDTGQDQKRQENEK